MRLLLYTRHNVTPWARAVASKLTVVSESTVISELRGEGDAWLTDDFYRYYRMPGAAKVAVENLSAKGCEEVIARCRTLRHRDPAQALRMIGAVWLACERALDRFRPDVFLAFRIDSYVLDVMDRVLSTRRIPYVGLWRAALVPDMIFFTKRGEYTPVREPQEAEVQACVDKLTAPDFRATSLRPGAAYGRSAFLKAYAQTNARDAVLSAQRWLHRDPLGYRYLTTGRHVPEYKFAFGNWRLFNYVRRDWVSIFENTPRDRRVFIGLQVNPEATIDYYVKDIKLVQYERVLNMVLDVLEPAGYTIFIKDHPNMFGRRSSGFIERIAARRSVVFVPYEESSNHLVAGSAATFTWTGTIGLQASMAGTCPVVVDPTYLVSDAFVQIRALDDIADLPCKIQAFRRPDDLSALQRQTARHVLRSYVPGTLRYQEFRRDPGPEQVRIRQLCETLDCYLPLLVNQGNTTTA